MWPTKGFVKKSQKLFESKTFVFEFFIVNPVIRNCKRTSSALCRVSKSSDILKLISSHLIFHFTCSLPSYLGAQSKYLFVDFQISKYWTISIGPLMDTYCYSKHYIWFHSNIIVISIAHTITLATAVSSYFLFILRTLSEARLSTKLQVPEPKPFAANCLNTKARLRNIISIVSRWS